jgi:hypothetical protein
MKYTAPIIPYDATFVGEFIEGKPVPADHWAKVTMPVLVADGGASLDWMGHVADALAKVLPNASRQPLAGQTHLVDPSALALVMIEFLRQ